MPSLSELKALVKNEKGTKPKLNAGKEALLLYAEKAGLLQKKEASTEVIPSLPAAHKVVRVKKEAMPLPDELKAPIAKVARGRPPATAAAVPTAAAAAKVPVAAAAAAAAAAKKPATGFAAFMMVNKGCGLSMSVLAEKYRATAK